jgi:hypothetical protein
MAGRTEMPTREDFLVPADPRDPKAANLPKLAMGYRWVQFWGDFFARMDKAPIRDGRVTLTDQSAAIATTPVPLSSVSAGVYRITYYLELTVVAGVSSSVTPTFRWTAKGGTAKNFAGAAMNANTLVQYQQDSIVIRVDKNTAISYEAAYASNPAGGAKFALDIQVETVKLDAL